MVFDFMNTLPETNITPESLGLEDKFPFGKAPFGRCDLLVLGSVSHYPIISLY